MSIKAKAYTGGVALKQVENWPIWGDNWWIEKNKAWFIWGSKNILCYLDLEMNECELLACVPEVSKSRFRGTSICNKYGNDIYCMPIYGRSIWVYSVVNENFCEICINNPKEVLLNIRDVWEYNNRIYAISTGLGQLIEIDLIEKKIKNYYSISQDKTIVKSIRVDSLIYILLGENSEICRFNLETKETNIYRLPDIGRKFNTICFDGEKFWLSGYRKEIYVWDQNKNEISILDIFPRDFGMYDFTEETDGKVDTTTEKFEKFTFLFSVVVGQKVWFISYYANKILYVDKVTNQIQAFEIEEENETKESLLVRNRLACKYLLDYVKDDRYMGLYSVKNQCILEIDTIELKYKYKYYNYHFSDKCMEEYANFYNFTFNELNVWELEIYKRILYSKNNNTYNGNVNCIGTEIYKKI